MFVVDEEEEVFFLFLYGVDIFISEVNGFEMLNGDFFDLLDFDGSKFLIYLKKNYVGIIMF